MAAASGAESVLSLLDARMHEVYCAHYRRVAADDYQLLGDIHVLPPQAVGLPAGTGAACGNALRAYPELQQRIAQQGWVMQPDILPEAAGWSIWPCRVCVPGRVLMPLTRRRSTFATKWRWPSACVKAAEHEGGVASCA